MGVPEMEKIAELIHKAITEGDTDPEHAVTKEVRAGVDELVTAFPAYPR
jgi:glycine hydroxymethyltransferase